MGVASRRVAEEREPFPAPVVDVKLPIASTVTAIPT